MNEIDIAWDKFLNSTSGNGSDDSVASDAGQDDEHTEIPKCSDIYISTKTVIAFLDQPMDLNRLFWAIPVVPYENPTTGVIKKQMKTSCEAKADVKHLDAMIAKQSAINVDIISQVDNPTARKVKFKDVRKINIGLSKKDLVSYRTKKKGAFYNCFVLILRIDTGETFREVHVKVFNTGKLEIPGIQKNEHLRRALDLLIDTLQPLCDSQLLCKRDEIETVLINSNFSANYYIDRDRLYSILKYKYKLHAIYDPCSYPGIQCKFYHNEINEDHNGVCHCANRCNKKGKGKGPNDCLEISFMVFRTGSVLIVGHCDEDVLGQIYSFLCRVLHDEYASISTPTPYNVKPKSKGGKLRKRTISVTKNPVDKP